MPDHESLSPKSDSQPDAARHRPRGSRPGGASGIVPISGSYDPSGPHSRPGCSPSPATAAATNLPAGGRSWAANFRKSSICGRRSGYRADQAAGCLKSGLPRLQALIQNPQAAPPGGLRRDDLLSARQRRQRRARRAVRPAVRRSGRSHVNQPGHSSVRVRQRIPAFAEDVRH